MSAEGLARLAYERKRRNRRGVLRDQVTYLLSDYLATAEELDGDVDLDDFLEFAKEARR